MIDILTPVPYHNLVHNILSSLHSPYYCRDNDIDDVFDQTFSVEHDRFGRITHHDLLPNGQEIRVTNENKKEYVRLYVQWRFRVGVDKQFLALQRGFHELVPPNLLKSFDEKELELVISGLGSVDVEDWKVNTRLKHCTSDTSVVKWFWKVCVRVSAWVGGVGGFRVHEL